MIRSMQEIIWIESTWCFGTFTLFEVLQPLIHLNRCVNEDAFGKLLLCFVQFLFELPFPSLYPTKQRRIH